MKGVAERTQLANAGTGGAEFRFYRIAHRIAARMQPRVRDAFLRAVKQLQDSIDVGGLEAAIAGGAYGAIEAAAGIGRLGTILTGSQALEDALVATAAASGDATAKALAKAARVAFVFDARYPDAILYARQQVADLVVAITPAQKEAIRIIVGAGQAQGLTPVEQARAIREVVGLPPNWVNAPLNLEKDIRDGNLSSALRRRLSATDKAQIKSRMRSGDVTDSFIRTMRERYAASLTNRRALNIGRTESLRASTEGQYQAWGQAIKKGHLPANVRRVYIVTPDDRLRKTHAAVPGMNPGGVGMNEPFKTPLGPKVNPPIETDCRCGVGLQIPGQGGRL